jgi:hypothetical protein
LYVVCICQSEEDGRELFREDLWPCVSCCQW